LVITETLNELSGCAPSEVLAMLEQIGR